MDAEGSLARRRAHPAYQFFDTHATSATYYATQRHMRYVHFAVPLSVCVLRWSITVLALRYEQWFLSKH